MIIFTNGCFDIIHVGHVKLLEFCVSRFCKTFDNSYIVVGLNSDNSIKQIKGPNRPINNQNDRKIVLESIKYVDQVVIFDETNVCSLLERIKPNIWVKGGDYNLDTINQEELKTARKLGIKIEFFDYLEGYSTTKIIEKI
jgi:rfaE bifunctional protein nucleotidyltransferase chain/domain